MAKQVTLYADTDPVIISFTESNHRYKVVDPVEHSGYKTGVTTILRVLNKPALMQYAANKAVDTFYEAYKLADSLWTKEAFKELCKKSKYAHITYRDAKADIGKNVHSWIEQHIAGTDNEVTDEMKPSVDAFLLWEKVNKPEYIYSERILYSKEYDYCGAMDCGAIIDGIKTIIDFKTGNFDQEYDSYKKQYTGKGRSYNEHFIQQGGYSVPLKEETGWQAEMLTTLYLPVTGGAHAFSNPFVQFFEETFLAVLDVDRRLKKADKLNEYIRS
jgi:hypothetical protein